MKPGLYTLPSSFRVGLESANQVGLSMVGRLSASEMRHMTIIVRRGRESDAMAICQLLRVITPLVIPDPTVPEAAKFLESFEGPSVTARLNAANYCYFVAEEGTELRGYIALRDGQHLYHLFVHPMFHRQGIGRLLWQHLLQATGSRTITVRSSLAAVPVYRSFGFTPSGEPQLRRCPAYLPMEYKR